MFLQFTEGAQLLWCSICCCVGFDGLTLFSGLTGEAGLAATRAVVNLITNRDGSHCPATSLRVNFDQAIRLDSPILLALCGLDAHIPLLVSIIENAASNGAMEGRFIGLKNTCG